MQGIKKILYNYRIIAQKPVMLRQVIRTINTGFIQTCALSQLSFVLFWTYTTLFLGLLLTLTLTWKSKKTVRTSLDLVPLFNTSAYARVEGLISNMDYLENWCHSFIQNKYGRKRCLLCTYDSFSGI